MVASRSVARTCPRFAVNKVLLALFCLFAFFYCCFCCFCCSLAVVPGMVVLFVDCCSVYAFDVELLSPFRKHPTTLSSHCSECVCVCACVRVCVCAVATGWTREECIESLAHKAGYRGSVSEALRRTMKVLVVFLCLFVSWISVVMYMVVACALLSIWVVVVLIYLLSLSLSPSLLRRLLAIRAARRHSHTPSIWNERAHAANDTPNCTVSFSLVHSCCLLA